MKSRKIKIRKEALKELIIRDRMLKGLLEE